MEFVEECNKSHAREFKKKKFNPFAYQVLVISCLLTCFLCTFVVLMTECLLLFLKTIMCDYWSNIYYVSFEVEHCLFMPS